MDNLLHKVLSAPSFGHNWKQTIYSCASKNFIHLLTTKFIHDQRAFQTKSILIAQIII